MHPKRLPTYRPALIAARILLFFLHSLLIAVLLLIGALLFNTG